MIIRNGLVFQEDGTFRKEDVYIENHKITDSEDKVTDKTEIDAEGLMVIPGLVDIHSHGAFGYDFSDGDAEGLKEILRYEKRSGITSYCPTSMTLPRSVWRRYSTALTTPEQERIWLLSAVSIWKDRFLIRRRRALMWKNGSAVLTRSTSGS